MKADWTMLCPPRDAMPTIRPNLTRTPLTLDEQSFEELLSAAFTVQEHNERRKRAQQAGQSQLAPQPESSSNTTITCPHCGALKLGESSRCATCGLDEFRPGERLQRNWASMWLKSQQQGLWPERFSAPIEPVRKIGEPAEQDLPPIPAAAPLVHKRNDFTVSGFEPIVLGKYIETEKRKSEASEAEPSEPDSLGAIESEVREVVKPSIERIELYTGDEFGRPEAADAPNETESLTFPKSILRRLADIEVTLRFHRADLYLGLAVFVALLALLWPAASSPKRASLSPWERALVTMGIAEAPAPSIHLQGDPSIEVWVDPHTALYYCPGAEPYGKTADGRLSTQREAQLDRFEPAGRTVCE